jgi:hypothetical protein
MRSFVGLALFCASLAAAAQEAPIDPPAPPAEEAPTTTTTKPTPPATTPPETTPPAATTPPAETTTTAEPAPLPAPAPAPAPVPAGTTTTTSDPIVSAEVPTGRRVGDPVPLTRREPTLKAQSLMAGVRYGLVGSGPTRFVDDVRYSLTDEIELRTALYPWPAAIMARGRFGSQQSELGALIVEGGLAYFDAGLRLVEDTGEPQVGVRFHLEGDVGYARAVDEKLAVHAFAHYRARFSLLPDDDQHALAADAHLTYDLLPALSISAGLGIATTLGTPVREVVVNFVETDRPGISHLLARDDGLQQSLTVPLTLTYGRVDSFDVDLFCTTRVWPELGILFGAGVRFRMEPLF